MVVWLMFDSVAESNHLSQKLRVTALQTATGTKKALHLRIHIQPDLTVLDFGIAVPYGKPYTVIRVLTKFEPAVVLSWNA